jgi:hypothetical protein
MDDNNDENLSPELLDSYFVSFFSRQTTITSEDDDDITDTTGNMADETTTNDITDNVADDATSIALASSSNAVIEPSINNRGRRGRGRGERRSRGRRGRGQSGRISTASRRQAEILAALPILPDFTPFVRDVPYHQGFARLPQALPGRDTILHGLIGLFFSQHILATIVINTNEYAQSKNAGIGGREWTELTLDELKIWMGILLYMGVIKLPRVTDYWTTDFKFPKHYITQQMPMKRFQQIKRYLHISNHNSPMPYWYSKVEPFASHIRDISKRLYVPGSNVSIDEMIIRFSGRSGHTFRIKNKPTPEGYKIMSLCEKGYTYTFTFESRIVANDKIPSIPGLNKTGSLVSYLVTQLPTNRAYNIYMDNYFTSIPLFHYLRTNGYGACGTVRVNSAMFPASLKIEKSIHLDWNTLSGVVVNDVLAILWIDNGPVHMLTTIHGIKDDKWKIPTIRRRPRETSSNAINVRRVFGEATQKEVPIPKAIDDYNHFMGGVDIADQYRSYYNCQLTASRTWMPLMFWLIDTAIVNSYILYKKNGNFKLNIIF